MTIEFEGGGGLGDVLMKVAVFAVVQALVYVILSKSSNVFSKTKKDINCFKPARSESIRRILAVLQDLPPGGETSPSSCSNSEPNAIGDDSITASGSVSNHQHR